MSYTPKNIIVKLLLVKKGTKNVADFAQFWTNLKNFFLRPLPLALKKALDNVQLVKTNSLQSLGA